MNIDDLAPSKSNFLKKEDVGVDGVDLVIKRFYQDEIKNAETGGLDLKYCIEWTDGNYKPMVLNKENVSRLKMALKTSDTDEMLGKLVNVYHDEFVAFGGKTVGGIRIRPIQRSSKPAAAPRPQQRRVSDDNGPPTPPPEAYDDDVSQIGR